MLNGGARFEVACVYCAMRFVVDRIRDADARAMRDHLWTVHPTLLVSAAAALGDVFDHYRVTPSNEQRPTRRA